jgi:hypothetical protein
MEDIQQGEVIMVRKGGAKFHTRDLKVVKHLYIDESPNEAEV